MLSSIIHCSGVAGGCTRMNSAMNQVLILESLPVFVLEFRLEFNWKQLVIENNKTTGPRCLTININVFFNKY